MRFTASLFCLFFLFQPEIYSQFTISGNVSDSTSGLPVGYSEIEVISYGSKTGTDIHGNFYISLSEAGKYLLRISKENYYTTDTAITLTGQNTAVHLQLYMARIIPHTDTIDVNDYLYKKSPDVSTSFLNSKYEEIRKNPGSFEDVVKYYTSVPGVISGHDNNNHLLVRGGSSFENLILIDGFEIPNPNHYGPPGSSNGALSYINSKLIGEVDFYSGGFPARFGDKISSVMDINFREGNRKNHIRDLNLSVTGYGAFFEGPISKKGSYMFSLRKSYFELVKEQLATSLLPSYWDFNTKFSYDLSKTEKLSYSGTYVIDHAESYKLSSNSQDTVNMKLFNGSFRYINDLGDVKVSSVTGYSSSVYDAKYFLYDLDISDRYISTAQNLSIKLYKAIDADFATGLKYYFSDYRVFHDGTYNESGYSVPQLSVNTEVKTIKMYGAVNLRAFFFDKRLKINGGIRVDYFGYMFKPYSVSPRFGAVFRLFEKTSLTANAGIYFQAPELSWLVNYQENRELDYIKCSQIVIGAEQLIGKDIKVVFEGYLKQYNNYPVSVFDPNYIFINSGVELYPNFLDKAVSAGRGYYKGIDLFAEQKNSSNGLFWSAGYSYSNSKFLALVGDYQTAEFDPGHQINLIAGYKFPFGLSISGHFKYTGGRPYTPYDLEKSYLYHRGIFVENSYNKARLPEYSRLDLRIEQEMHPFGTDLVIYLEVLNVLNKTNLYEYGWDFGKNEPENYIQFRRLPIAGISWKF